MVVHWCSTNALGNSHENSHRREVRQLQGILPNWQPGAGFITLMWCPEQSAKNSIHETQFANSELLDAVPYTQRPALAEDFQIFSIGSGCQILEVRRNHIIS